MQKSRNSIANALELRLFCKEPSIRMPSVWTSRIPTSFWPCPQESLRHFDHVYEHAIIDNGINSSPPSVAYMRQWIRSALIQIMACRLFGA